MNRDRPADSPIREVDAETLRWAVDAARLVRSPVFPGAVLAILLVTAGVGVLLVSGVGLVGESYVSLQLPFLISGGFGAVGLVIAGALLTSLLGNRRDEAMADEEYGEVLRALTELARDRIRDRAVDGAKGV